MLRAVIFDMDGVIIDSEPAQVEAERQLFLKYGIVPTQEDWATFVGRTTGDFMAIMARKYGIKAAPEELVRQRDALYAGKLRDSVQLMPGFRELASSLSPKYRLALTSSSSRAEVEFELKKFKIAGLFSVVVTGDDVTHGKPHPEPYEKTISLLGLSPAECAVIEDAVNGISSAKEAGALAIGLAGSFPEERLARVADAVVRELSEVPKALGTLEKRLP